MSPLVVPQGPEAQEQATEATVADQCEVEMVQSQPHRITWARLLKRVFDVAMQNCPNCGAEELKIIAAILERPVIEKILTRLGLDPQPPPRGRARRHRTRANPGIKGGRTQGEAPWRAGPSGHKAMAQLPDPSHPLAGLGHGPPVGLSRGMGNRRSGGSAPRPTWQGQGRGCGWAAPPALAARASWSR